jgi:aspartyl-tRNA(Asn)/glutamyl-tRNA(Gln) amidotransferase subunit B
MYTPVIGLEIHLQVKTKTKMFCRCESDYFEKEPNINTCPVCFGLSGALPVPNKVAFEKAIKLALALNCEINQETKFDRKNYFYPDLPKGYQISQYDQPIGEGGFVQIEIKDDIRRIRLQRVHLEEDTAKSIHAEESGKDETLINYNKSGVALIEIVTKPDFESVEEVTLFAKRLRQIVRYLDISDAEMQKGQMRFELNISMRPDTMPKTQLPDYKVEVKNIGSISVLEKVIRFEMQRQSELLEKGEKIQAQTRGLKYMSGETLLQRAKETADDYRYFPEPDIPPIHITSDQLSAISSQIGELPADRKQRYLSLGLEGEQADIFIEDVQKGQWFDAAAELITDNRLLITETAKWIIGEISGQLEKKGITISELTFTQKDLIELLKLVKENKVSGTIAKDVISRSLNGKGTPVEIIERENLLQIQDSGEVEKFVKQVIDENAKIVADIAKNPNAIKALVGQVMKLSKGKVNPRSAEEELRKQLVISN